MTIRTKACTSCIHWRRDTDVATCDAFPEYDADEFAIPPEILFGGEPHVTPWPGDHGIMWELDSAHATTAIIRAQHPLPWKKPGTPEYAAAHRGHA
jgi:hypothetical protein